MPKTRNIFRAFGTVCLAATTIPLLPAQQPAQGVPVNMVVTVEPKRAKAIPSIEQQDVKVSEGTDKRPVTGFMPLQAEHADMQLLLMLDDSASASINTEIGTLKQFVTSLPSTTEVGVGYMRNGMTQITQKLTTDHAAAANAIRVVMGPAGADVSPYDSLSDA